MRSKKKSGNNTLAGRYYHVGPKKSITERILAYRKSIVLILAVFSLVVLLQKTNFSGNPSAEKEFVKQDYKTVALELPKKN